MTEVLRHVLLVLALGAVGAAALRVAARIASGALERILVAVVLAVSATVAVSLALGLVGLGTNSVVLLAAAAGAWAAAARLLPAPRPSLAGELRVGWARLGPGARHATAAGLGAALAWLVWQLRFPAIGFDSALYHYPFVAGWLENGRPGTGLTLSYEIPYGSYPLTDEVAQTYWAAIARSWVPLALWTPALLAVLGAATWGLLRDLAVPRPAAGLGAAALVTLPLNVRQLNEAQTDLPALTWLMVTAALAVAAGRRPALLGPAVLAAGLSLGTKPSTGPLVVAALAVGAFLARAHLRPLLPWLGGALAGAVVVGGVWYLRNLVEHGSPVWPFAPGPFGDPAPAFIASIDATFLERPRATLEGQVGAYVERLAGALALLAAVPLALGAALVGLRDGRGRPAAVVAGVLALAGTLIWSTAWGTGQPTTPGTGFPGGFAISSLRYLLPALGAAVVAIALVARAPGALGWVATAVLAAATGWNVVADALLGAPYTPPAATLALGAAAGAAVLALGALATRGRSLPRPAAVALAAVAVLAAGVGLARAADGFLARHAALAASSAYGRELVAWTLGQPEFADGEVAIASRGLLAQLTGEAFRTKVTLVPQDATCAEVEAIARRRPVVVTPTGFFRGNLGVEDYTAPGCLARIRPVFRSTVYAVYRLPPA